VLVVGHESQIDGTLDIGGDAQGSRAALSVRGAGEREKGQYNCKNK
jgi:hypothetical protein